MKSWAVPELDVEPHSPRVLSSSDEGRAITLAIPAGESLDDHQVHERAWVSVLAGQVQVSTPEGEQVEGGVGMLLEFEPGERHAVRAVSDARLLLLLTPWPGDGHPGTMSIEDKGQMRERAAERRRD